MIWSFLGEFWLLLRIRKKYWLLPVLLVMVLFGGMIAIKGTAIEPSITPPPIVPEDVAAHRDMPYVTNGHKQQKLDLYVPKLGDNLPLIVWVHGGAWTHGDKNWIIPLRFPPLPRGYFEQGYAIASVEYRFSQHAIFPAQIQDAKAAVRWLRAHAAEYRLDPNRFAAWGASAGGHLVSLLGAAPKVKEFDLGENLDVSSEVQAVVDYYGPVDFPNLPEKVLGAASGESLLIGGSIRDNPDKARRASPIAYISKDTPPFLIVHGDHDPAVDYHQSVLMEAALKKFGVPVTFYTVKGGGHGLFTDPQVPEVTQRFLADHFHPASN
jgi:acetyl esterase/lipase